MSNLPSYIIPLPKDIKKMLDETKVLSKKQEDELRQAGKDLEKDPDFVSGYLKMIFVEEICRVMEEKNINITQLAKKMNMERKYVKRILNEKSRFNFDMMARIAIALDCEIKIQLERRKNEN